MTNQARRKILLVALKKAGIEFRQDSILCKKYISGDDTNSLEFVVERMCQMKYLYDYCYMHTYRNIAYNELCIDMDDKGDSWFVYKDGMVSKRAEELALVRHSNCRYPKQFPWQLPQNTETLQMAIDHNNEVWIRKILRAYVPNGVDCAIDIHAVNLAFASKNVRQIFTRMQNKHPVNLFEPDNLPEL